MADEGVINAFGACRRAARRRLKAREVNKVCGRWSMRLPGTCVLHLLAHRSYRPLNKTCLVRPLRSTSCVWCGQVKVGRGNYYTAIRLPRNQSMNTGNGRGMLEG